MVPREETTVKPLRYVYVLTRQYDEMPYGIFASLQGAKDATGSDKYEGSYWDKVPNTNLWEGRGGACVWCVREVEVAP